MATLRQPIRHGFFRIEGWYDRVFGAAWNPFYALGALGFYFYWIVAVSGLYLFAFYDTGVTEAFQSIEEITYAQWWLGGIMRSLHRYASDGLVVVVVIHMLREWALDRYRGARWYSWLLGVPAIWLMFTAGITGYWLVWDRLAQYIAEATSEILDRLPIFGASIARNFLAPSYLDDRFFTLMLFMHIALPLVMLFVMWFHVNRVAGPKINPPRGLAIGTLLMLLVLSLAYPAVSQGMADLARVPAPVGLDWYYLWFYPLADLTGAGGIWLFAFVATLLLMAMPWLPPKRDRAIPVVHLDYCNGCTRCADDCPYGAVVMAPRTDGNLSTARRWSSHRCASRAASAPVPARRRRRSGARANCCRASISAGCRSPSCARARTPQHLRSVAAVASSCSVAIMACRWRRWPVRRSGRSACRARRCYRPR